MTPELATAQEALGLAQRKLKRHQTETHCRPPIVGYRRPGSYDEDKHRNRDAALAEHVELVQARDEAVETVKAIEADLGTVK